MAVAYLAATAAEVFESTTAAVTSGAYDSGATGSNRVLVVAVFAELDTAQDVTAVSYGGTPLTHRRTQSSGGTGTQEFLEIWTLDGPTTGSNTLAITIADTGNDLTVVAAVFTGATAVGGNTAGAAKTSAQTDYHGDLTFSAGSAGFYAAVCNQEQSAAHTANTDNTELLEGSIATGAAGFRYSIGWRGPEAVGGAYDVGTNLASATQVGAWGAIELLEAGAVATKAPPGVRRPMRFFRGAR